MSDDDKFLRVLEAKSQDVGRGIVRVDPEVVEFLHLREGDPVIVEGRKKTAAIVARALPEDANRGSVRLDGFQRRNAQIGLDEKVGVRPVAAKPATKVTLAPTEPIRIMGGEEYLAQALDGRVVTRGDVVSIPVMGRRFEFVVQSFAPTAEAVEVSTSTKVKISEKPAKEVEAKVPRVSYEDIGGLTGEVERRVVAQLLSLMDGLSARGKVVVIGATNRPNSLDPAIRRPGRFDREIEIGIPDRDGRLEILQIHARNAPLAKDVELGALADITHGYVGADIGALVKEAAMRALRRILPDIDLEVDEVPMEVLKKLELTKDDFLQAFREMEPSTLREVLIERPNVRWYDIGGAQAAAAAV